MPLCTQVAAERQRAFAAFGMKESCKTKETAISSEAQRTR